MVTFSGALTAKGLNFFDLSGLVNRFASSRQPNSSSPVPAGGSDSAYDIMVAMLREWGLESLAPDVREMLEDGRTPEQIQVLLQDTSAYKKRFSGNEQRRKNGLAVLSPGEYLATEAAYRQIMESAGLPKGFYDSPKDFAGWIGNDVAPSEIRSRVDAAQEIAFQMDEDIAAAFKDFYGVTQSNLAAFFLDRDRGLDALEKISRSALIGGAASAQDLDITRARAEQLAGSARLTPEQYRQAFGNVAGLTRDVGRLAAIHGGSYGQREAEEETFFANEEARRRRRRLIQSEEAEFSGGSGVSPEAFARPTGQV